MGRRHRSFLALLAIAIGSAWFARCSKEALFTSEDIVDLNRFRDTTLYAVESYWANAGHTKGNPWLSRRLVVANAPGPLANSTFFARSFLWFTSLPETTAKVEKANLFLYITRWDCNNGCGEIGLRSLTDTLDQFHIWWDRMPSMAANPIATFSVSEPLDSVVIDMTSTVQGWIDGTIQNFGIALVTDETPGAFFVAEIASRETPKNTTINFRPKIRIVYVDTADTSGEVHYFESEPTVDTFSDTLLVWTSQKSTQYITCGNGVPSRGFLMFDVAAIPIEATVSKAVLKLSPDFENSSFDSIDLICHAVVDSPWTDFDSAIGRAGAGRLTVKHDQEESTVEFEITVLVQPLVARKVENRGFVIKSADEGADLDFIRFFGRGVSPELQPQLEIHYVLPPQPPYEDR